MTERDVTIPEDDRSYRLLFESNPLPMWVYDLEKLSFLAVNDAAVRYYGYSREEFLTMSIKDIRPPEDIPALLETVSHVTPGFNTAASRHLKKDGTIIAVEIVSHTLVFRGRRGELVLAMDVTERKRAEEEHLQLVREQAARAQAEAEQARQAFLAQASNLLTSSLDYKTTLKSVARLAVPILADHCLIDLIDESRRVNRVEVACADSEKNELARGLQKYSPNIDNSEVPVTRAIRTGRLVFLPEISDSVLIAVASDSEHLRILRELGAQSLAVAPLVARGRTLGAISFALAESGRRYCPLDLSLIEELAGRAALAVDNAMLYEEAQLANHAKDEFLATLSHELRTPLSSMLIWVRMLAAGKLDQKTSTQALNNLASGVKSLSQLVNDLLDVSRIVTGRLRIDERPVSLIPIIEAAIEVIRPTAETRKINFKTSFDPSVGLVRGDPERLKEVLWNVLSNAIKFSPPEGDIEILLEDAVTDAKIIVRDQGEGISPDFLPFVFDRFRQADSSDIRTHSGLGLGLAIVRHLVEMHGGTVAAESAGIGQGSTFTIKLPLLSIASNDEELNPRILTEPTVTLEGDSNLLKV